MDRNKNEYSELFYHCVQVINEYNNDRSEDVFLDEYFETNQVPNTSFVSVLFFDCNSYSALLKTIVDIFYKKDGINIRRSEQNIYKGFPSGHSSSVNNALLRGFVTSVSLFQAHQFMQFLVNEEHLNTIKMECIKLYEESFVIDKVIRVLDKYRVTLRTILLDLKMLMDGRAPARQVPETTKTKPFNLTTSKERLAPLPKLIPKMEKCRRPPKSTYVPSNEQSELEKIRDENHRYGLYKLNQIRQAKVIEDNDKNNQLQPLRIRPAPKYQNNKIPVKLNTAAILKEHQLYRKQEESVRQRLLEFEAGGRDAHEFFQWQETMQKQDYEQELNTIERRRLEGKISYEEAILAKQRIIDENRRIADEIRRQTRQAIEIHVKEKVREEQRMKQLVEEVVSGRDNAKIAQQKLQQYKIDFVKQYKEEAKQMMKQALEEAEAEMRQRAELIQQIRAYELLTTDRWKPIDLTSVPGYGLLDEMSIAELHERLELVKLERRKEREIRRDQIIREKQTKEKIMTDTVQSIAKHRSDLSTQVARKKRRNISAPPTIEKTHPELQQLRSYLETRKAQRLSNQQQRETVPSAATSPKRSNSFRSSNEWNRLDQVDKSYDKTQKRLAPTLIS